MDSSTACFGLDQAETLTRGDFELAFDQTLIARILRMDDVRELISRARGRRVLPG
ncbi:MAG: hypothetical protein ACRDNK_23570 [Solirubrobacteraceae bacterium]